MTASISVVVPTLGRPTLEATLAALATQVKRRDEVIVVADLRGDLAATTRIFDGYARPGWWLRAVAPNEYGHGYAQREYGAMLATGSHLCFIDDDDVHNEGALELMREHACEVPVIFRMRSRAETLWTDEELKFGQVGTPMFVVPNLPLKLGRWEPKENTNGVGGDYVFIRGCVHHQGQPIFRPEVVCDLRPHLNGGSPWPD